MKKEKLLNAIGQIDDELIVGAKPELGVKRKKVKVRWIAAFATCLVLALCVGVSAPIVVGNTVAGRITMEINPGIEYTVTKNGNVRSVRFLNDDARGALEEVSLKGQSLKTAVSLTLAAYKAVGYMEKNDTVLVSFDKKLSGNGKLKTAISKDVRSALEVAKTVHTVVYAIETNDAETVAIAKKYGISQGKAQLVGEAAENSDLTVDALVKLPLDELVGLQKDVDSVVVDTTYIGLLKAKAIALNDSGCPNRVEFTEARLVDDGIKYPYYRLVFNDKRTQWTYSINAVNGDVIEKIELALFISLEEAKTIALKDAGIGDAGEEKVVFTKEELSRNQGRPCWILEFYTKDYQYHYKIDAKTGEIIFFDYHIDVMKAKIIAAKDAGVYEDFDKITFTTEEYVGGGIKTPYFYLVFNNDVTEWAYRIDATLGIVLEKSKTDLFVPLSKAKEIALKDAEITEPDEAIFTKEELNRNQGRPCWVLEFYTEKYQYSYKIDAKTGEIIYNRRFLYIERAREIALFDAGLNDAVRVVFTVEELVDGGIKTPYFVFEFNDGATQWTYRIDATNGSVLLRDKTSMLIPLNKAKEIALNDANLPESVVPVFTTELLSRNQGRPCWVLEFYTKNHQYSYKIDAKTGEIIYNRKYIYIEKAREIVLKDVALDDSAKIVFTVEELVDGGIKTPYFLFVFNDGTTQWTYRIDATSGVVLYRAKDLLKSLGLESAA